MSDAYVSSSSSGGGTGGEVYRLRHWAMLSERWYVCVVRRDIVHMKSVDSDITRHNYPRRLYSRRRGYGVQSRLSVCLFVRALTGKPLEISTPNLVHIYSLAVARHALTQRSKGQRSRWHGYENRHGRTVASDVCCNGLCWRWCPCGLDCLCLVRCVEMFVFSYLSVINTQVLRVVAA